jgi:hypothetical protein
MFAFMTGGSLFAFFAKWLVTDLKSFFLKFQFYGYVYIAVSAIISFAFLYLHQPFKNQRAFNLIEFGLKAIAIFFLFTGMSYYELPMSIIFGYVLTNILTDIYQRVLSQFTFIPRLK